MMFRKFPRPRGRTVRRAPGEMNKTEAEYARRLDARKAAGEIACYWFERYTLRLADGCRYTPDFMVMLPDGEMEIHEVKGGFVEDDALVKLKVCAETLPHTVRMFQKLPAKSGGGWKERVFGEVCDG